MRESQATDVDKFVLVVGRTFSVKVPVALGVDAEEAGRQARLRLEEAYGRIVQADLTDIFQGAAATWLTFQVTVEEG